MGCRIVAVRYTTLEIEYYTVTTATTLRQTHHGVVRHLLDCEGPTDMPSTGVKIQPLDFLSTVSTNKMLYDIPGMVLLLVLMAV